MVKNPFYRRRDAGYTLVAVAIGIAILTILVAAVGPSIATIMKREREDELIFRGRQYARAIALFQRRYQRFPSTLKEMYDNRPRTIRKLWKDPMCRCDDWKLLIAGAGNQLPGTGVPGGQNPGPNRPAPPPTPTPGAFGNPEGVQGPIVGVASKIHKEGLREWRGSKYYDEWNFMAGDADRNEFGTGLTGPSGPGQVGPLPGQPPRPPPVVPNQPGVPNQ